MGSDGVMWRALDQLSATSTDPLDVTTLANEDNMVLPLANNNIYWQRNVAVAVTYDHPPISTEFPLALNTTVTRCDESMLLMWLCDMDTPLRPLQCQKHESVLLHGAVSENKGRQSVGSGFRNRRVTFMLACTAGCHSDCPRTRFGITLVQYQPDEGVLWNCVSGAFRGVEHIKTASKRKRLKSSLEMSLSHTTDDDEEVAALNEQVRELSGRVEQLTQQVSVLTTQLSEFKTLFAWQTRYYRTQQ